MGRAAAAEHPEPPGQSTPLAAAPSFALSFGKSSEKRVGFYGVIAVGSGAAIGAWLRWWLGLTLNPVFPTLPLGTLAANLVGGFLIGVAVEWFAINATIPPEFRLFVITGLLGGLTTFSTFSAETVTLLLRHQYLWAGALASAHLLGSLAMTVLGIAVVGWLRNP